MTAVGTVIPGRGRNPGEEYGRHHLYKYVEHACHVDWCNKMVKEDGSEVCIEGPDLLPMCPYGWNRSDGFSFSIFRGHTASRGECKLCRRNVDGGKPPSEPREHRTRWI